MSDPVVALNSVDGDWIVEDGQDFLVVDKPVGVPCMAPRKGIADDLPSRLKAHLRLHYLGTHQRLDRETSGLILYTRNESANAPFVRALETGSVSKRYVAAVRGWKGSDRVLDSAIDGKAARTAVRVHERSGDRVLLECRLETGRKHQIRRHLEREGCPIAGDALYGGPAAPRLLLHAAALSVGERSWNAALPREFHDWLRGADAIDPGDAAQLGRALRRAIQRRHWLAISEATTAFRLVNAEGDGVPGLAIDVYGEHLVAHLYDAALPHEETIVETLGGLGFVGIYVKRRPRQANVLVDTRRAEVAPSEPVWGEAAADPTTVRESGVSYSVRLGDGLSTGIFLDQRDMRERVKEGARGLEVLNLFAYTGAFSVAAAVGGARRVASVDVSRSALDVAEAGMAALGFDAHEVWRHDCFDAIRMMRKKGRRFDLIIADPPTYSKHKKKVWSSGPQWKELCEQCLSVAAPAARLLLCTNDRRATQKQFRRRITQAVREAGFEHATIRDVKDPADFPSAPGAPHSLKRVWVSLDPKRP